MSSLTKDIPMKHVHGKLSLLFLGLFLPMGLIAQQLAHYNLVSSTNKPYIKEAVEITFTAEQTDNTDVMFFFLEPKKSKYYKIILLKKEAEELGYHHKKTRFYYLLFPLKSGKVTVDFDFVIKVASDEAVAQVYEGSRDNVKWIETQNTHISLQPLQLQVKNIDKNVSLVGDFTIHSKIDKTVVDAYEGINLKYFLKGVGYDDFSLDFLHLNKDIEVFEDITKHYNKATKDGFEIQQEYAYVILAQKDFEIPQQKILCFSPKQKRYYTLTTKAYKIKVNTINPEEILDTKESPEQTNIIDKRFIDIFLYLLIFLAGYFSAKIPLPVFKKKIAPLYADINNTKTPKELLFILSNNYLHYQELEKIRQELETIVYHKKKSRPLKKIKEEVLEKISQKRKEPSSL
jgi:hypothetical protein